MPDRRSRRRPSWDDAPWDDAADPREPGAVSGLEVVRDLSVEPVTPPGSRGAGAASAGSRSPGPHPTAPGGSRADGSTGAGFAGSGSGGAGSGGRRAGSGGAGFDGAGPGGGGSAGRGAGSDGGDGAQPDRGPDDQDFDDPGPRWLRPWRRLRPATRVRIAVAAACVVAAVVSVTAYVAMRPTAQESAVTRAIERYTAAWNAHDLDAIHSAMTSSSRFSAGENLDNPLFTMYAGAELDGLLTSVFAAKVVLTTTGPISLAGDDTSHATVPQRFEYDVRGIHVAEDGFSLYTLDNINGRLRIAQHVWWRPVRPGAPSMLWTATT
jgi:hypothetical protein